MDVYELRLQGYSSGYQLVPWKKHALLSKLLDCEIVFRIYVTLSPELSLVVDNVLYIQT